MIGTRTHNPVMPIDLLVGFGGAAVFVGLGLDWSAGETGFETLSVLKVLLMLAAGMALLEPVVLISTRKTDLPVVWQTTFCLFGSVLALILVGKAVFPPEPGFGLGFYVTLAGMLVASAAAWTTVSREN
ncbi:MAG: hypothetical protein ACKOFX_01320 [Solirubrobacterales bacterium]